LSVRLFFFIRVIRAIRGFYVPGSVSFLCGFPPQVRIVLAFVDPPDILRAVRRLSAATLLLLNHELHQSHEFYVSASSSSFVWIRVIRGFKNYTISIHQR